jgi:hypothetical protein
MKFYDKTGMVFGRLTVIKFTGRDNLNKARWECLCECGNTTNVTSGGLATGNTTSCGCYLKERITKHGSYQKSSYNTWRAMKRRCLNPKDKEYKTYGAVGITICPEWMDYLQFEKDMGEPEGEETLSRIDPYGNYTKENCKWDNRTVQARNIRVTKRSKTGVIGVLQPYEGSWYANITVQKKKYYSRVYKTIEEAIMARKELEHLHWGV